MERLKARLAQAEQALGTLEALLARVEGDPIVRDAAIQRFEYSFETVWKAAQRYLRVMEGVDAASPKAVAWACAQVGVLSLDDARLALAMVDDRNLTAHIYNEAWAIRIASRLPGYAALMRRWLETMAARLEDA